MGRLEHGGAHGTGSVFELVRSAGGKWTEQVLYSFGDYGTRDGYQPVYGVTFDSAGSLYGTTQFGGTQGEQGWGTAFRLTPDKNGNWTETILHHFDENKVGGGFVSSGLVFDDRGNLYGSSLRGGQIYVPDERARVLVVWSSDWHLTQMASGPRPYCIPLAKEKMGRFPAAAWPATQRAICLA